VTPIEQIKAAIRLDEYASRYLVIKNKKAICFLHAEKTASMSVHRDYFFCHGCGAGGDIIKFASAYHDLTASGAVKMLAAELGIPLTRQAQAHPYDAAKAQRERSEAEEWKRQAKRSLLTCLHQDDYDRILPFLERLEAAPALPAYRAQRTPEQAVMLRESMRETDLWVKAITPLVERLLTA
jgi:DNA primase